MEQPQDYRLSLSARISVLEKVVQQLVVQQLSNADNTVRALADMRKAVTTSFDVAPMNTGGVHRTPQQQEWLRRESIQSKKEAEEFFLTVERTLGSTE